MNINNSKFSFNKFVVLVTLLICSVDSFVATYRRFDGIILPEHMIEPPKSQSSSGWWPYGGKEDPTTCNGAKLHAFNYKTKDLKADNHKELRKNGLSMHLQSVHNVLVGIEPMDDPIYCIEEVYTIYVSIHKNYLCYEKQYGLSCQDWEFNETTMVHIVYVCICVQGSCTYVLTYKSHVAANYV